MRKITLPELLDRVRQALFSRAERFFVIKKWLLPKTNKIFVADSQRLTALTRLSDRLRLEAEMGAFKDRALPVTYQLDVLRRCANCILEGYFELLGFECLAFGYPVDWHLEPTTGCRSPLIPWKQLDSLDPSLTGDKKVVWELNRHQHLLTLARAFLHTGDTRYAETLREHISSWIQDNPPTLGINWVSSLEIAFRCISWLWALALVQTWAKWPSLPFLDIERSLYLQGCHIERYLSTYFSPNTHLTGEALGLYYLGICLPELKRAERWRNLGRSILLEQLELQVRPDGVYFEQSTWYHRYTADFYLHFILLAKRAGEALPASVSQRLAALLDYLMWITRPDGTSPYVGDDDGGKLVKLEERPPNDWRAVLCNGAVMFCRGDYKHVAGEFSEETYWLFGPDAREKFERIPAKPPSLTSRAFVDGGFFVMRNGWGLDANYLLIDCGPHGVMNCGHAHADALSIELAALGATFLVDPGTFVYTGSAKLRDLFRSTVMHNTLTIDGFSSSVPAGPFKWKHVAHCTLRCWHDHPGFTFFEGSHNGYKLLPDPATHTRTVLFVNKEYWLMLDRADPTGEHEYTVHYHMAPDIITTLHQETGELTVHAAMATLDIAYFEKQGTWHVADGLVSLCYGTKSTAPVGMYTARRKGPVALLSVLFPRVPNQPPPEIQNLNPKHGKGFSLATSQFHDLVLWSERSAPEEGFYHTDFEWAWVRRGSDDRSLEKAVLIHGTTFSVQDLEMTAERLLEFVFVSVQEGLLSLDFSPSAGIKVQPPFGIAHILVNGGKHSLGSSEVLTLSQDEVPTLAVTRDTTEHCKHVRH